METAVHDIDCKFVSSFAECCSAIGGSEVDRTSNFLCEICQEKGQARSPAIKMIPRSILKVWKYAGYAAARSLFVQVTHIYSLGEEVGDNIQCLRIT